MSYLPVLDIQRLANVYALSEQCRLGSKPVYSCQITLFTLKTAMPSKKHTNRSSDQYYQVWLFKDTTVVCQDHIIVASIISNRTYQYYADPNRGKKLSVIDQKGQLHHSFKRTYLCTTGQEKTKNEEHAISQLSFHEVKKTKIEAVFP